MMAFTFGGYQLREALAQDLELARAWTAADPDHAGRVLPEFWLTNAWLLSDSAGPIFFFRGIRQGLGGRELEIHIQFAPGLTRQRLTAALMEGMAWLEANTQDVDEIRFDSKNFSLIRFCEKRLGFTNAGGKLTKRLAAEVRN
jgi:hypothetical protein